MLLTGAFVEVLVPRACTWEALETLEYSLTECLHLTAGVLTVNSRSPGASSLFSFSLLPRHEVNQSDCDRYRLMGTIKHRQDSP